MRRALIWLKLYSREADRHKLKKGRKTLKMHFLPVLELMSDSLTTMWVEPNQSIMCYLEWVGLNFYHYDGLQPKNTKIHFLPVLELMSDSLTAI